MNNEFIHLWPCAMLTAGLMLVFKCMSADQARDSVEWSIFVSVPDEFVDPGKTILIHVAAVLFVQGQLYSCVCVACILDPHGGFLACTKPCCGCRCSCCMQQQDAYLYIT
jgi:hypothetical protein